MNIICVGMIIFVFREMFAVNNVVFYYLFVNLARNSERKLTKLKKAYIPSRCDCDSPYAESLLMSLFLVI
jgi:hypothetical protein